MNFFWRSKESGEPLPAADNTNSSAPQCAVCLLSISRTDGIVDPSGCGHTLHLQCFMQAVSSMHSLCPTCRAPFKTGSSTPPPMPSRQANDIRPIFRSMAHRSVQNEVLDPVPSEEPLIITSVVRKEGGVSTTMVPAIELIVSPEVPAVAAGSTGKIYVNVSISAPEIFEAVSDSATPSNCGIDLVAILDKSGSMGGEKLILLKEAVAFVIGELTEKDRMSTISFDNRAYYRHGLVNMNEPGKRHVHQNMGNLIASGGTNILSGLQKGVALLNARKVPNSITAIFLLTDGIDDSNLSEKINLARQAKANGWFLYVFAFGNSHNATHLNAIANAADSSYVFIDNLSTLREAFGGTIGSQKNVAGQVLTLRVTSNDSRVLFHRASSGEYVSNISSDQQLVITSYPNILCGEKRDLCLEVSYPASSTDMHNFVNAELMYTPINSNSSEVLPTKIITATCLLTRPAAIDTPVPREESVDVQINRITCIDAIKNATVLADANQLIQAREVLNVAKASILSSVSAAHSLSIGMSNELTDCLHRIQSEHEWKNGGRSTTIESTNVLGKQRGLYAKRSKYDGASPSSANMFMTTSTRQSQITASPAMPFHMLRPHSPK